MRTGAVGPDPLDRTRFPADPWRLVERHPEDADLGLTETLFAVANGYIGMRGNPEEGREVHEHGTFVNGFHETWPIRHAEAAYGFARTGQTIVNVPDAKLMKVYVDDEPLVVGQADLEHYEREPATSATACGGARSCGARRRASGCGSTPPGWSR